MGAGRPIRVLNILIAGGIVVVAAVVLWNGLWVADDAYITFRHIAQLLDGNGLTYNAGERVEGFSHPLWALMLAVFGVAGLDVPATALVLNLTFSMAVIAILVLAQLPRSPADRTPPLFIPLSAGLLLGSTGFLDFATSGLEVALSCLLLTLLGLSLLDSPVLRHPLRNGALISLIYLTRPDLGLYAVAPLFLAGWAIFAAPRTGGDAAEAGFGALARAGVRLILAMGLPALAYHLFRWFYYGELWPNTFYAKAGASAYWSQGRIYLSHFLEHSPTVWVGLGVLSFLLVRDRLTGRGDARWRRTAIVVGLALHVLYVVRLGGDFMAFRFFVPDLAVLAVLLLGRQYDEPIAWLARPGVRGALAALVLVGVGTQLARDPRPDKLDRFIADERQHYESGGAGSLAVLLEPPRHPWWEIGRGLRELQRGLDGERLRVATGNIGFLGYAAGTDVWIIDQVGLVDRRVARNWDGRRGRPRGRPGHEDKLTPALAFELGVQIWTTPFPRFNRAMATPYGTLISLDPALLAAFPGRAEGLAELKRRLAGSHEPADLRELELIALLEANAPRPLTPLP